MLKRISLVLVLLAALFGVLGVQAQSASTPQSMAKYLPANVDIFLGLRTDEAFLDELNGVINTLAEKFPAEVAGQLQGLNLKALFQAQVGSFDAIGVGGYVALGAGNTQVLNDSDPSNDSEAVFYTVIELSDAAKFEAFFEKTATDVEKSEEDGITVYTSKSGAQGKALITSDAAYFTIDGGVSTGDKLDSSAKFNDTISHLPESSYNFVIYADTSALVTENLSELPSSSVDAASTLGLDVTQLGPVALAGTILDGKSLVIDSYTPSLGALIPTTAPIDSAFKALIPAGTSYVIQGTDLKSSLNALIELAYKANESQSNSTMPSREDLNKQLKAALGIDLDNDILGWMGGNYALIGDADVKSVLEQMANGDESPTLPTLSFALIVQGDGSDKPVQLARTIGNILTLQSQSDPTFPKPEVTVTDDKTTVLVDSVPLSGSDVTLSLEIAATGDLFLLGDKATVESILSGEGGSISDDASYVEAQTYILPNASVIAYADGEGWGNVIGGSLFAAAVAPVIFNNISAQLNTEAGSPTPTPVPTANLLQPLAPFIDTVYGVISSSSASVSYSDDGSQLSRLVLTLK